MIFLFMPETKQRTLEELDYIFAVPLSKFISYQTKTWLPWWWQRYVLRKDVKLAPLYKFEEGVRKDLGDVADVGSEEEIGGEGVRGKAEV
jgi:hypothetical protein